MSLRICRRLGTMPECNFKPAPYKGIPYELVVADRKKYCAKLYFHYYKDPLLITEGHMQYLFDHRGNRYLDLISGISTVGLGHSHPAIVKAISDQSDKYIHTSTIFMTEWYGEYSRRLCEELGPGFDSVYLTNSGGEANDFAITLARLYTKTHKFLSLRNGYHGLVGNAGAVTNVQSWNADMVRGVEFEKLAWPSEYRGAQPTLDGLIRDAEEVLTANTAGKVAGFIAEPIQGVCGINPLPDGYLPKMAELVRKYHGLVICDEVQTGFGRVGKDFWGHKWRGVKPDIVTMAKGIANGLPLGAVVTRKEIAQALNFTYFNTFAGGPMSCRAGIAVLDTIRKEKLHLNAETIGDMLLKGLRKLQAKYPVLGDVRGKGLMIGLEFVKDPITKAPAKDETAKLMELTRERGLLFGKGGAFGNVLRIQPPLCITEADAKYTLEAL